MYKLLAHGMSKVEDSDNDFTMGLDPDLFVKFLDTPERIVLEFTPEMSIPFDGDKMAKGYRLRLRGVRGQGSKRRLNAQPKIMSIKKRPRWPLFYCNVFITSAAHAPVAKVV
jgi:hypothetical protein